MSDQSSAGNATTTVDASDPLVSLAFAMGWQMADLYRQAQPKDTMERDGGSLPDVGGFKGGLESKTE